MYVASYPWVMNIHGYPTTPMDIHDPWVRCNIYLYCSEEKTCHISNIVDIYSLGAPGFNRTDIV